MLRQQVMLEDAVWSLVAHTCAVEVLARELLSLMRVVAVLTPVAVSCQEELAQILT